MSAANPGQQIRLTAVWTHPVQYIAPWFRWIHAHCPDVRLQVLYVVEPSDAQQGSDFGASFQWDVPLRTGYENEVLRATRPSDDVRSDRFLGVDAPGIGAAIRATRPDAVLLPGWYAAALVRALLACKRAGIPVVYRGDSIRASRSKGWRGIAGALRARVLLRAFDAALSVGQQSDAYLLHAGMHPARIVRAPHCIDLDRFQQTSDAARQHPEALRDGLGLPHDAFVVLFVGKLTNIKRPLDAVEAVARLEGPAVLAIAGSGPLQEAVRARAATRDVRVVSLGFLNQSDLPRAYAAADCVLVPSESETWGLVVNEALACGTPCVVSDAVGCAPDLIGGAPGTVVTKGDVEGYARALSAIRDRPVANQAAACRSRASQGSFAAATAGLVRALRLVTRGTKPSKRTPRVLALCGGMVRVHGLEHQTFHVLRVIRAQSWPVHCVLNPWGNREVVPLVEDLGATWSTGRYLAPLSKRVWHPRIVATQGIDLLENSRAVLRAARRFRPSHVLAPEMGAVLRHAPALRWMRWQGVRAYLRAGNVPERTNLREWLWRRAVAPHVDRIMPNSEFGRQRLLEAGVPDEKIHVIYNAVRPHRTHTTGSDLDEFLDHDRVLLCVGQVAPFKGTDLAVSATQTLLRSGHDVRLLVVGALPSWPESLRTYAASLREATQAEVASGRIRFAGQRPDVLGLMARCWLLVAPIRQEETFGNVALEAKSCGLPVVATNRGGLPELVEHQRTGFLCEHATEQAIAEGVAWFLEDPTRRDAAAEESRAFFDSPHGRRYRQESFHRSWLTQFHEQ